MAILVQKDNENKKTLFEFDKGEFLIGRDISCNICIIDSSISRRHIKITKTGDVHKIEDLDSINGTLINGKPEKSIILKNGDRIKIGDIVLVYYTDVMNETLRNIPKSARNKSDFKILIVDDSEEDRVTAKILLSASGFTCDFAENGLVALQKLAMDTKYCAVFIDTRMPVMDGCTTIQRIRKSGKYKDLKIICTSSTRRGSSSSGERCIGCLADGHISKPFDWKTFADVIKDIKHTANVQ